MYNDGYQMNLPRWEEEEELKAGLEADLYSVQIHYISVYQNDIDRRLGVGEE